MSSSVSRYGECYIAILSESSNVMLIQCNNEFYIIYRMAGKFDGEFGLTFYKLAVKLISVDINARMHARHMLSFRQIKIRQIFKNTIWRGFRQINFLSNFPPIQYKKFYLFCSYHDHLKNAIIHEIQGKARMK